MTLQDIFDKVALGLLEQDRKALRRPGTTECMYLAPDGAKCAAGQLIDPSFDVAPIEGASLHRQTTESGQHTLGNRAWKMLVDSGVPDDSDAYDLAKELQAVHDNMPVGYWAIALTAVAARHGVSNVVVTKWQQEEERRLLNQWCD